MITITVVLECLSQALPFEHSHLKTK